VLAWCVGVAATAVAVAAEPARPAKKRKQQRRHPKKPSANEKKRRAAGAEIVSGKYLFARGLPDRYSNARLGLAPLPSSEPDRRAVPLSALPPALRQTLTIERTFLPDRPADFAGGSLHLETGVFPERLTLKIDVRGAANTMSSFRSHPTYPGGFDYFGIDDGMRALPSAVPANQAVRLGAGSPPMSPAEVAYIGRSFSNVWGARRLRVGMDHGLAVTLGDTHRFEGGATLGHILSLTFDKSYRRLVSEIQNPTVVGAGQVAVRERFVEESGQEKTALGAFFNTAYSPSARHTLALIALFTQSSSDSAQVQTGRSESVGLDIQNTRLRFLSEGLLFSMLEGKHRLSDAGTKLAWQLHFARTTQDQPDLRDMTYDNPGSGLGLRSIPGSGERLYTTLVENSAGAGVDATVPLGPIDLKTGALFRFSRRAFLARRFWFELTDPTARFQSPEVIFAGDNIGRSVRLDERTLASDHYDADVSTLAAYLRLDARWGPLELAGGVRFEYYRQDLVSLNPLVGTLDQLRAARRTDVDPLPAIDLRYRVGDAMLLRASYGNTVSRPQLRELSPFKFFNFTRQRLDEGNPKLGRAYIHNADLRFEMEPARGTFLGAGFFYKYLAAPIERVIFDDRRNITYENADSAQVFGVELDVGGDFGALSPRLAGLSASLGAVLSRSRVSLKPEQVRIQTSAERPLQGQSPYTIQAKVAYEVPRTGTKLGVSYGVFGPRIVDVGSNFLPDVFEQPFHRVDVSVVQRLGRGLTLKLAGQNVLNQPISLRSADLPVLRYRPGADVFLTLAYSH
jgi:hypothetical protein